MDRPSDTQPPDDRPADPFQNRWAGTVEVQLAGGVLEPAVTEASHRIGQQLLPSARPTPTAGSAIAAVLADPITFSSVDYRPLPAHSALGLSAFYVGCSSGSPPQAWRPAPSSCSPPSAPRGS